MSATYPMDMVRGRLTVQVPLRVSIYTYLMMQFSSEFLPSILQAVDGVFRQLMTEFFSLFFYLQTDKPPTQYRGIFHALKTVFVEEGPRALYKGWLPSVIGVVSIYSIIGPSCSNFIGFLDYCHNHSVFWLVADVAHGIEQKNMENKMGKDREEGREKEEEEKFQYRFNSVR